MATNESGLGGLGFGGVVSSLFGGDAGKRPGAAHTRVRGRRNLIADLYLPALIPALLLLAYGLVVIWSASLSIEDANFPRQVLGGAIGLACAAVIWRYDYRNLANMTTALLVIDVVLMLLPHVPGLSYSAKGMTGWIKIPIINQTFQPSELAKLVTIFLMAALTAQYNGKIKTLRDYIKLCAMLCVPFILILTQPDLGTGLIVLVVGASIIICGGAKRSWVLVTLVIIVLGATVVVVSSMTDGLPHILKEYQLKRLIVFVDPSVDPTGDGYNLQQAEIAVGSGGFFGKGIGNATQAGQGFLPEAHTDFVFALLAEEFGFLGAIVLLALFGWLFFSTIRLAMKVESPFSKLILVGVVTMWAFQLLENVGMCIGIMPITGIPLPFISYGSSSMVVQLASVGVVQSVWKHRTKSA
ncbi:MAG: rod shape-determining protein RodA [Atopobiaceae bacterium]|jgi:rod shape determining protein RodA|nr:rod shape-determining protein RodA [Atopobiaceae bacterium]MCI2173144.1 rod shape-determining protein RodA [Atopobiaceae bacterium]MCI2208237.1 rod shape-determining protein RodA [Atopobiaceae bacterium]